MADLSPSHVRRRYWLHGLILDSELEFPALSRDLGDAAADVTVRFGAVPRSIEGPRQSGVCYQARAGEMLFWLDGVARFHVAGGREITVEPAAAAPERSICALLQSSPLAALLLQRGLLPLHASAVATPRGAVVFAGPAAQGKSTLAAAFARQGAVVLADNIAAVRMTEAGAAFVLPGAPALQLWPDALVASAVEANTSVVRPGVAKRLLACAGESSAGAVPLSTIYWLERGPNRPSLTELSRKDALVALLDTVYRPAFVHGLQLEGQVFAQVEQLTRVARVARIVAPTVEAITEDLAR